MARTDNHRPAAVQASDLTLPGVVVHNHIRVMGGAAPCDYHPDNNRINARLVQTLGRMKARRSPEWRRCLRQLPYRGGCNSFGRIGKVYRKQEERSRRRLVNDALGQIRDGEYERELDLPVKYHRNMAWELS